MVLLVEILSHGEHEPVYPTILTSLLLMVYSPGNTRSQAIISDVHFRPHLSHGIDLVHLDYSSHSTRRLAVMIYRKISNIRRTKSPNLNVSRLTLQLSLPNPMKPGV